MQSDTAQHSNTVQVEILWGDCDPAGIVFYPNYFRMFNAATDSLFASAGLSLTHLQEEHGIIGYPMIDARAMFLSPNRFGEAITILTRAIGWGRSSFEIEHVVHNTAGRSIEAYEKRVWGALDGSGKLVGRTIPDVVRKRLGHTPVDGAR